MNLDTQKISNHAIGWGGLLWIGSSLFSNLLGPTLAQGGTTLGVGGVVGGIALKLFNLFSKN